MNVLIKLLPELSELIEKIGNMPEDDEEMQEEPQQMPEEQMPEEQMGALANVQ